MTQIIPREDEEPSFKTFGNKTGRDRETFGVTNNAKLTLDPEYLEKTSSSSISDIIKLKEPTTLESSKPNKPTTGPSSGFKFDIKKMILKVLLMIGNKTKKYWQKLNWLMKRFQRM